MPTPNNTHVIMNPASAAGRTGRQRREILSTLETHLGGFSLDMTSGPLQATIMSRAAIQTGKDLIIAVGGDGTVQEVVNGFFHDGRPIRPECQLGIVSSGTGHGFAQSLGLSSDIESQCRAIAEGTTRRVDVGRAVFATNNGSRRERYFVNECQAGIGGQVVRKVGFRRKMLGGRLAFGLGTLVSALTYAPRLLTVSVDGGARETSSCLGVVVANGGTMAGGMKLVPPAEVGDGLFDILVIRKQNLPERLRNFPKIYSGDHIFSPKFGLLRGSRVTLDSQEDVAFEADGELWGLLPCKIEILPSAILLRAERPRKE